MQQVKDQHTVPKCYLKNFSEDGSNIFRKFKKVTKEDLTNIELRKPTSLKKATTKEHFYTVDKGTEPMVIESIFYSREIENYYPKYYELLINPKISKLESLDDRSRILMCLLTLHCRTPKQFNYFFKSVPENFQDRIDLIKEDYKTSHIGNTLINFIQTHEYKTITIVKINDSSEFITSDNPVLILNPNGELINHKFKEQFNKDNVILIPLDHKHCCILKNATDKNGISIDGKVFYNGIKRIEENCNFAWEINAKMIKSADLVCYGREKYIKTFFSVHKFID